MNEPRRYREGDGLAGELFRAARDTTQAPWPGPARAAQLRRLRHTLAEGPNPWRAFIPSFALALALGLLVLLPLSQRHRWSAPAAASAAPTAVPQTSSARTLALGATGTLRLAAGTEVRLPAGAASESVELRAGEVCADIAHRDPTRQAPFVVRAPGLSVFVIGTRFCVEASPTGTRVTVSEGRVRVEGAGEVAFVSAGERFERSTTAALAPLPASVPAPLPVRLLEPQAPATSERCLRLRGPEDRADCYARLSGGEGLAAQNALYSLALLARDEQRDPRAAAGFFRAYLARFSVGPLAPEAREQLAALAPAPKE